MAESATEINNGISEDQISHWDKWIKENPGKEAAKLAELEQLTETDPLTGVKNKRGWSKALEALKPLVERNRWEASFLIIDVNRFKEINDKLGHEAGDQCLIFIASIISDAARKSDIVARLGGDEFGLFLPQAGKVDAMIIKGRIEKFMEEGISNADSSDLIHQASPDVSIGISQLKLGETTTEAIARADKDMYQAKKGN